MCRPVNHLTARGPERLDGRDGLPTEVAFRLTAERQVAVSRTEKERWGKKVPGGGKSVWLRNWPESDAAGQSV